MYNVYYKENIFFSAIIEGKTTMEKVIQDIKKVVKNRPVLIACSTGVDSMVLFTLLLQNFQHDKIIVAHVNHKKRKQSEEEEEFIKHKCDDLNIKCYILHLDHVEGNFQSEARNLRYQFFIDVAEKENIEYILLAHHANDNVETIVMRLLKSSSLKGYGGIEKITKFKNKILYRPLIKTSKSDIIEFAKNNGIKYYDDASNQSLDYTRNRIRHLIVPLLLEENPNLYEAINYYSETILNANEIIEEMEQFFINTKVKRNYINNKITYTININDYLELSEFMQKQILFRILKPYNLSHNCITELIKKINSKKSNLVTKINNKVALIKEYGKINFTECSIEPLNLKIKISKEGTYQLKNGCTIKIEKNNCYFLAPSYNLCYNIQRLPIIIRNREVGDRIDKELVSDYLTKLKIPFLIKKDLLLICDQDNKVLAIAYKEGGK